MPSTRVILHAFTNGATKRQIAADRGTTLQTVETYIKNGRSHLRQHGYTDTSNCIRLGEALAAYERDETARIIAEWRHMTAV